MTCISLSSVDVVAAATSKAEKEERERRAYQGGSSLDCDGPTYREQIKTVMVGNGLLDAA
jgi:hypothetical protein